MMLPSGNDAAVTIAENFGDFADDEDEMTKDDMEILKEYRNNRKKKRKIDQMDYFISQMNFYGKKFDLKNTYYANPHGNFHF